MAHDDISALAQALRDAFHRKDPREVLRLGHPEASASSVVLNYQHNKELMDDEFTVSDYRVSDYQSHSKEVASDLAQSWAIVPPPTHVVEFVLEYPDGRKRDMFYRCAQHNGKFVVSYYRGKDDACLPSARTIDLRLLFSDMREHFRQELGFIVKALKTQSVGYFDISYQVGWAPGSIDLSAQTEELLLTGSQQATCTYARYLTTDFIHQAYRDLLRGCREIITHDGEQVNVNPDQIRETYPDWEGEFLFRDALKRCLAAAFVHELNEGPFRIGWLGRKVVRIASYDDAGQGVSPLNEFLLLGDIAVYSPSKAGV